MGYVVCGVHGSRCCWKCDECPKCSGKFKRVSKGDYCPDCTKWLKANGYVWSRYYGNFMKPWELPDEEREALENKVESGQVAFGI
jgi:hypothetical protein